MSFFDVGSFAEPKLSMEHFREWAGEISNAYLTQGVAPTETLVKIAQSQELTPESIKTLAGEANKVIHQTKYAAAADKYLAADFPLADSKAAIARLQMSGETKLAAVMPDPAFADTGPDPYQMFNVAPEVMDKTAGLKGEMKVAFEKLGSLKEKLADAEYLEKCALDGAERDLLKQARQMVLQYGSSSAERMKTLGGLDQYTKLAGVPVKPTLAKLAYALAHEGLLLPAHAQAALTYFLSKEADVKAPECLISENLPARVVNGTHPLYITLKTFHDHQGRLDHTRGRSSIVDDKINILRQRIRAL